MQAVKQVNLLIKNGRLASTVVLHVVSLPAALKSLQFSYPGLAPQRKQLLRDVVCFMSGMQDTYAH